MRVLILSQGKSGSTAIEAGLRSALDIKFNGQVFEPRDLRTIEIPATAVVKKLIDHWADEEATILGLFERRVFLVRDPRDNLLSRLLYMPYMRREFNDDYNVKRFLDLLRAKIAQPKSLDVRAIISTFDQISGLSLLDVVGKLARKTIKVYETWGHHFLLFRYEEFIAGDDRRIVNYIGTHLPREITVMPELRRVERSRRSGEWKHWVTEADNAFFNEFYSPFYKVFGYIPEPLEKEPIISQKDSIDYVVRIVNEGRQIFGIAPYMPAVGS